MLKKFFAVLFCLFLASGTAYANDNICYQDIEIGDIQITPFASLYIGAYDNVLEINRNDSKKLDFTPYIKACKTSDVIKISGQVQELKNGKWVSVSTFSKTEKNAISAQYSGLYTGTKGSTYKIYVEFYVENAGGSDTRTSYSNLITI